MSLYSAMLSGAPSAGDWTGKWVLIEKESSNLDLYGTVALDFKSVSKDRIVVTEIWGDSRSHEEAWDFRFTDEILKTLRTS